MHNILRRVTTRLCEGSIKVTCTLLLLPICRASQGALLPMVQFTITMLYFYVCFFLCFLPNFQCNVIFHSFFPFFIYSSLPFAQFFSFWTSLICQSWEFSFEYIFLVYYFVWTIFFLFTFNLVVCLQHKKKIVPFFSLETLKLARSTVA